MAIKSLSSTISSYSKTSDLTAALQCSIVQYSSCEGTSWWQWLCFYQVVETRSSMCRSSQHSSSSCTPYTCDPGLSRWWTSKRLLTKWLSCCAAICSCATLSLCLRVRLGTRLDGPTCASSDSTCSWISASCSVSSSRIANAAAESNMHVATHWQQLRIVS